METSSPRPAPRFGRPLLERIHQLFPLLLCFRIHIHDPHRLVRDVFHRGIDLVRVILEPLVVIHRFEERVHRAVSEGL
jgi:hypothetical protein